MFYDDLTTFSFLGKVVDSNFKTSYPSLELQLAACVCGQIRKKNLNFTYFFFGEKKRVLKIVYCIQKKAPKVKFCNIMWVRNAFKLFYGPCEN